MPLEQRWRCKVRRVPALTGLCWQLLAYCLLKWCRACIRADILKRYTSVGCALHKAKSQRLGWQFSVSDKISQYPNLRTLLHFFFVGKPFALLFHNFAADQVMGDMQALEIGTVPKWVALGLKCNH